jgi:hypothetical protein
VLRTGLKLAGISITQSPNPTETSAEAPWS